jgi:hypothetical protein
MSGGSGTGTRASGSAIGVESKLDAQLAADLTSVFFNTAEFAESVPYAPSGGMAKTITIIPDAEDPASQTPYPPGDSMIILARSSEVMAPGRGDTYTIDGVTWYHEKIVSGGPKEGIYHILLTRSARRDVGGRTFI